MMDFTQARRALDDLPSSWGPRREQPERDRDFSGKAEIRAEFGRGSFRAIEWVVTATAFSEIIKGGYSTGHVSDPKNPSLAMAGRDARAIIKAHHNKNGKS